MVRAWWFGFGFICANFLVLVGTWDVPRPVPPPNRRAPALQVAQAPEVLQQAIEERRRELAALTDAATCAAAEVGADAESSGWEAAKVKDKRKSGKKRQFGGRDWRGWRCEKGGGGVEEGKAKV